MLGLSFEKLLVIGLIAVFLIGPTRLPAYAAKLGQLVRNLRRMTDSARERMRDEMGPEFADIDWQKLDPRQYDPRRIIRDALLEGDVPTVSSPSAAAPGAAAATVVGATGVASSRPLKPRLAEGEVPPFDAEAT